MDVGTMLQVELLLLEVSYCMHVLHLCGKTTNSRYTPGSDTETGLS